MKNKVIVHITNKNRINSHYYFQPEVDSMEALCDAYGVKNYIFYKGDQLNYFGLISKLERFGIFTDNYANKQELKKKLAALNKEYEIIFVYTPLEFLIKTVNEMREFLGHPLSDTPDIFRNKFLQREAIQKHNPELGIKFLKSDFHDLDRKTIEKQIGYPFIIKPVDGVQSSGVQKISNKKDFNDYINHYQDFHDRLKARGVDNKDLIIEEFIDGQLYSIDYFVNDKQEITISKAVKVLLGVDIGVKDYANIARITTSEVEYEMKGKRIRTFINATITACGIRNTFVHHEFKITKAGKLKTIELNGRIGGGRQEIIQRSYNMNLLEMLVNHDIRSGKLKEQNIVFNIYATKRGILESYNEKLVKRIENRPSVYDVSLDQSFIGKEIGLTKDGFIKMGTISLAHKDGDVMRKDFKYIKSKYKQLLILEDQDKLLTRFRYYFG